MDLLLIASLASILTTVGSFLKALFGLGVVVFVHELGHFLVAKACGVKCEKFYVGFDVPMSIGPFRLPSAFFRKQWGETEYGIGIIPLGGYVKMLGQDDNPANAATEAERIRVSDESGESDGPVALDPRSYPAKPVWQRMAIISAGVIMNIIFAVVFATIAFRMGVDYTPTEIAATMPGSPAWVADLQPGDRVVQIGKDGRRDEQLSFRQDLTFAALRTKAESTLDFLIRRRDGSEIWKSVRPRPLIDEKGAPPMIGAVAGFSLDVHVGKLPGWSVTEAKLQDGDRVLAAEVDGELKDIVSPYDLLAILREYRDQPITLTVARLDHATTKPSKNAARSETSVTLQAQALQDFGFMMRMGPVSAIRRDSPAERAGFQVGDRIIRLDDASDLDPMLLDDYLLTRLGRSVDMIVERTDADGRVSEVTLSVIPEPRNADGEVAGRGQPTSAESIGLAYFVTDIVEHVTAESAADKAGIEPGDRLTRVSFMPQPGSTLDAKLQAVFDETGLRELVLTDERYDWPEIFWFLQGLPRDVPIAFEFDRSGDHRMVTLDEQLLANHYHPTRGIHFSSRTDWRIAEGWKTAIAWGWREAKAGVEQVVFILRNIGRLYRSIGGPVAIATFGTQEASAGLSRLLIFLTMLSANLAVLNFLPIPVLDGGHMMFLMYEGIMGKPVNERVAFGLTLLGLFFILSLMVLVFGWDIYRLFIR